MLFNDADKYIASVMGWMKSRGELMERLPEKKTEELEGTPPPLFQCPFGHHKSHKNWTQTPTMKSRRLAAWAMARPSRFRLHVYTGSEIDAAYKRNGSKGPFFERKAAEAWKRQCVNPTLS